MRTIIFYLSVAMLSLGIYMCFTRNELGVLFIILGGSICGLFLTQNQFNTNYLYYKSLHRDKIIWFPKNGVFISIMLFLNDPFRNNKERWVISTYDNYEAIETRGGLFLFPWKLYYRSMGYSKKKSNFHAEKRDPKNANQVTYWQPWMNAH